MPSLSRQRGFFGQLSAFVTAVGALLMSAAGCSQSEAPQFHLNEVEILKTTAGVTPATAEQRQQIVDTMTALFGTPDEPHVFPETGLDLEKIRLAAGPVHSDQQGVGRGLYREHCAHCHGITGDGLGPTADSMNPYPRDYRRGIFKFKSTARPARPTDADLRRILEQGIPDTSMPSFRLLAPDEIDALVEYVKYLSMRGEMEIRLINRLYQDEETIEPDREVLVGSEDEPGLLMEVADAWKTAPSQVIVPAPLPAGLEVNDAASLAASAERGRELFFGAAGCVKCHGASALGDGQATEPDDWNKDIKPEHVAAGALKPRIIVPRNLRAGRFRGGDRPVDLYYRLYAGINGTPMPGLDLTVAGDNPTIKPEEIWHIVSYVRSLAFEEGWLHTTGSAAAGMQP